MSVFRRHAPSPTPEFETAQLASPTRQQTVAHLGDTCFQGYCAEADISQSELTAQQEELIDVIDRRADLWSETVRDAGVRVAGIQERLLTKGESNLQAVGLNSKARRNEMNFARHQVVIDMAKFRNTALQDVNNLAGLLAGKQSILALTLAGSKHRLDMADGTLWASFEKFAKDDDEAKARRASGIATVNKELVVNPYHRVFALEGLTRLGLASLIVQHPEVAATMLAPTNLEHLPDGLQSFIATELAYDTDSLVMNFLLTNQRKEIGFFDYLAQNNLGESAKQSAYAIGLGASALSECECPMNAFGICRTVADRIPEKRLPQDIRDDMVRRQQVATARLLADLKRFSNRNKVSQMWAMDNVLEPPERPEPGKIQASKRPSHAPVVTASLLAESLTPPLREKAVVGPKQVEVAWKGGDGLRESTLEDTDEVSGMIEDIMAGALVRDYIKEYRHQKDLHDFIRVALQTILTTANYRTEPSIRPMIGGNVSKVYSVVDSRRELSAYRLSGRDLRGNGGRPGMKMRIYFGVDHTGTTRRVEIRDIVSKDESEKKVRRSLAL